MIQAILKDNDYVEILSTYVYQVMADVCIDRCTVKNQVWVYRVCSKVDFLDSLGSG